MAYGLTYSANFVAASSQYLSIADASQTGLDITGDLTFEAWIKVASQPSSGNTFTLGSKYTISGNQRSYQFNYYNNAGTYQLGMNNSTDGTSPNSASSYVTIGQLTIGQWYHIAVIFTASSGGIEAVLNGVSQGTNTGLKTSTYNGTSPFALGARADGGASFMDGNISLARIWDTTRTVAQIKANMCSVLGSTTNLQGEWQLNNALTDNSGNSNTLTNNNVVTFQQNVPYQCVAVTTAMFFEMM